MSNMVMVVDDEESIVELYKIGLEDEGFEIVTAQSGNEAIGILKNHGEQIKMIISDIRMPNGSGIDLLRYSKENFPKIPVSLVSGYADHSDKELTAMGARQLLMKPIAISDIVRTVLLCLGPAK